jgi:hypothetical protein
MKRKTVTVNAKGIHDVHEEGSWYTLRIAPVCLSRTGT